MSSTHRAAKCRENAARWQKTCVPILVFATISLGPRSSEVQNKGGAVMDLKVSFPNSPGQKPNTHLLAKVETGKLLRLPTQTFSYSSGDSASTGKSGAERKAVSWGSGLLHPKARDSPPPVPGPSRADSPESGAAPCEPQERARVFRPRPYPRLALPHL